MFDAFYNNVKKGLEVELNVDGFCIEDQLGLRRKVCTVVQISYYFVPCLKKLHFTSTDDLFMPCALLLSWICYYKWGIADFAIVKAPI